MPRSNKVLISTATNPDSLDFIDRGQDLVFEAPGEIKELTFVKLNKTLNPGTKSHTIRADKNGKLDFPDSPMGTDGIVIKYSITVDLPGKGVTKIDPVLIIQP